MSLLKRNLPIPAIMKRNQLTLVVLALLLSFSFLSTKKPKTYTYSSKTIEKTLGKVNDSLFASPYEVSNAEYQFFLTELKQSGNTRAILLAQIDSTKWSNDLHFAGPMEEHYHQHPAFGNYPVVNITQEGARLYCEWLTNKYHADPKRMYKKVVFRLPTEEEWEYAARGGKSSFTYPWGGPALRNNKGCLMCNFSRIGDERLRRTDEGKVEVVANIPIENVANSDEFMLTAPVQSYWPNDFGLYNMSGNVSEMVQEKGISKGGGWKSLGYEVRIDQQATYNDQAQLPTMGFRYFMEVLEH